MQAHGSKISLFWGLADKDFFPGFCAGDAAADQPFNVISLSSLFPFRAGCQGRDAIVSILVLLLEAHLVKDDNRRSCAVEAEANLSQKSGVECGVHIDKVRQRNFIGLQHGLGG